MKDSFFTLRYKSFFIHGHYDRVEKRQYIRAEVGSRVVACKSVRGAKSLITRALQS